MTNAQTHKSNNEDGWPLQVGTSRFSRGDVRARRAISLFLTIVTVYVGAFFPLLPGFSDFRTIALTAAVLIGTFAVFSAQLFPTKVFYFTYVALVAPVLVFFFTVVVPGNPEPPYWANITFAVCSLLAAVLAAINRDSPNVWAWRLLPRK